MQKKLPCYLKTYRRRAGLSQKELAALLGIGHVTTVSKLERRKREPNLKVAFGCQVLFGIQADRIFPGLLTDIDKGVRARARQHGLSVQQKSYAE